jgi:predicted dehydrogenase
MPYAKLAAENGTHFFTEAGVTDDGLEEVIRLCENKPFTAAPSCTMRFHPSIKVIKDLVDQEAIGDILTATYHCGQYLPDWHPWEDYTTFYAAQRETGACREIVAFELVWLTWVLGGISLVSCFKDKLTKLDIDIDDAYHMLLRFKGGCMANYLVEVVSRQPIRHVRLMSEQGIIEWVQSEKAVRLYEKKTDQWRTFNEPAPIQEPGYVFAENMYIDEMRAFVESCTGIRPYPYSYTEDRIILKTLYACETSMLDGRHLDVSALYG